jgi:hypothetical protein
LVLGTLVKTWMPGIKPGMTMLHHGSRCTTRLGDAFIRRFHS